MTATRRLTAILAADVAGYSRLMGQDEAGTARALREHRVAANPLIAEHAGRIVKTTGDGILIEFASVVGAVECALALQRLAAERNTDLSHERRMEWRTGVHLGDVLIEGDDILGDGVNIAARLEGIAEPGGIRISEDAFRQVRGKVDAEFADAGEQRLKNIAQPMRVYRVGSLSAPKLSVASPPALPLPDKPSIAVLPFANMSGDPEQDYFADGMVEEIITALSRIRWLFVIARNSSFTYKGQSIDVKQVGRELGVRYVLEGSVRKAGGRVRITAQLIDALTGAHLWADRFDGSLEDIFDLQDKVALSIAGVVEPALQAAEIRQSVARPTNDLTAYDLYLRARSVAWTYEREHLIEALELLGQAITREPRYGPALALAGSYRVDLENYGWADDRQAAENRCTAINFARQALAAAADDPGVLGRAAMVLGRFSEDIDAALALIDRALKLNPSFAYGWYWSGWLHLFAGQADMAIHHFETSMRLNPRGQRGFHLSGIGLAHLFNQRFDDALAALRVSLEEVPAFVPTYRTLATCYALMGRHDEARSILARLTALTPIVQPTVNTFCKSEHRELLASGLRLAAGKAK